MRHELAVKQQQASEELASMREAYVRYGFRTGYEGHWYLPPGSPYTPARFADSPTVTTLLTCFCEQPAVCKSLFHHLSQYSTPARCILFSIIDSEHVLKVYACMRHGGGLGLLSPVSKISSQFGSCSSLIELTLLLMSCRQ